jgi:serine/threonine protein kinase
LVAQKPDNVGFNYVGVLKIFDFGLAKKLDDAERTKDGLYNMTSKTGAVRYMSPENLQGKPYDLTTDVYSWAMIMWFVLALEPPFATYSESMIEERVCQRGYRPKLFKTWSARISKLISCSWNQNPKERPSFANIAEELKKELAEVDPMLAQMVDKSQECLDRPGRHE